MVNGDLGSLSICEAALILAESTLQPFPPRLSVVAMKAGLEVEFQEREVQGYVPMMIGCRPAQSPVC